MYTSALPDLSQYIPISKTCSISTIQHVRICMLCVYPYLRVYTCLHVVCVHACMCVSKHVLLRAHVWKHVRTRVDAQMYVGKHNSTFLPPSMCAYVYIYVHTL